MSQTFWKFLTWLSIACSGVAYFVGWYSVLAKKLIWGISPEFYFYDSIAAGIFGVFFLVYAIHFGKKE